MQLRLICILEVCEWVFNLLQWPTFSLNCNIFLLYALFHLISKQVIKVIWQKGCIATGHGQFSRIRQVAPMALRLGQLFLQGSRSWHTNQQQTTLGPLISLKNISKVAVAVCYHVPYWQLYFKIIVPPDTCVNRGMLCRFVHKVLHMNHKVTWSWKCP